MVPDTDEYRETQNQSVPKEKENFNEDYEYENDETENSNLNKDIDDEAFYEQSASAEFGSRLKETKN